MRIIISSHATSTTVKQIFEPIIPGIKPILCVHKNSLHRFLNKVIKITPASHLFCSLSCNLRATRLFSAQPPSIRHRMICNSILKKERKIKFASTHEAVQHPDDENHNHPALGPIPKKPARSKPVIIVLPVLLANVLTRVVILMAGYDNMLLPRAQSISPDAHFLDLDWITRRRLPSICFERGFFHSYYTARVRRLVRYVLYAAIVIWR